MKRFKKYKKLTALLLAFVMAFAGVSGFSIRAEAQTSYMKKLRVPFGIKQGRPYHFTQKITGIGDRDITWTLKNVKIKKAKKKGFKELSCIVDFAADFSLSPLEVDVVTSTEYSKANNNSGAHMWFAVVDGETGLDIEDKNDVKVKVKSKRLDYRYNTFYGSDMETWQNAVYLWSTRLVITYPSDYEDMCIGFGGGNVLSGELKKADGDFWKGKVPFGKTTLYTKGKTNSRWLAVSSIKK